ncbi:MAG TPA: hypothetical protein VEY91_12535 [Candidatus Limnocylindria bacterium]|nr:hypothetical protein [Candidatus Limnocylindria bacterium]
MYKTKPCTECEMPAPGTPLKILVLNASLKHGLEVSNTEEVAEPVLENMKEHRVASEIIRLADCNLQLLKLNPLVPQAASATHA